MDLSYDANVVNVTGVDSGSISEIEIPVEIPVIINTPEVTTGPFDITIDIGNVVSMNGGQIDLSFDPSVMNVTNVTNVSIGDTTILSLIGVSLITIRSEYCLDFLVLME